MALVRTEAFLLKLIRFGETSAICRFFTRERGVVPVIARGARRPRSRFGAALEPFHRLQITFSEKPGREVQTLTEADLLDAHRPVARSLERLAVAGSWFRFLRAVLPDGQPAEPLFDLAVDAMQRLETTAPARLGRWETWHRAAAAAWMGFAPQLDACAGCGRDLPGAEPVAFSIPQGGLLCGACAAGHPGSVPLTPSAFALLALYHHPEYGLLEELESITPEELRVQQLIHRFIASHADLRPGAAGLAGHQP